MGDTNVVDWTEKDVHQWAERAQIEDSILTKCIVDECLDGKSLLALNESDVRDLCERHRMRLGNSKRFWIAVRLLQRDNHASLVNLGLVESSHHHTNGHVGGYHQQSQMHHHHHHHAHCSSCSDMHDMERNSPPLSIDGRATSIQPEVFKAMISLGTLHIMPISIYCCLFGLCGRMYTLYKHPFFIRPYVYMHNMYVIVSLVSAFFFYMCSQRSVRTWPILCSS